MLHNRLGHFFLPPLPFLLTKDAIDPLIKRDVQTWKSACIADCHLVDNFLGRYLGINKVRDRTVDSPKLPYFEGMESLRPAVEEIQPPKTLRFVADLGARSSDIADRMYRLAFLILQFVFKIEITL